MARARGRCAGLGARVFAQQPQAASREADDRLEESERKGAREGGARWAGVAKGRRRRRMRIPPGWRRGGQRRGRAAVGAGSGRSLDSEARWSGWAKGGPGREAPAEPGGGGAGDGGGVEGAVGGGELGAKGGGVVGARGPEGGGGRGAEGGRGAPLEDDDEGGDVVKAAEGGGASDEGGGGDVDEALGEPARVDGVAEDVVDDGDGLAVGEDVPEAVGGEDDEVVAGAEGAARDVGGRREDGITGRLERLELPVAKGAGDGEHDGRLRHR
mmetsp:Transcript_12272/g.39043  ORF Transcript_12272/g.39043 Transcript_12272/m.39043 type:complete len:270 (-) Transcript_12272:637-1446(-)